MTETKKTPNTFANLWRDSNFFVWLVLFLLFCCAIYVLRTILLPFVLGIILGYLFDPLVVRLEKLKISRTWATILVFLLMLLMIVPTLFIIFYAISAQLSIFISAVPNYISAFSQKIEPFLEYLETYFPSLKPENLRAAFSQNATQTFQVIGKLTESLLHNGMAVFNILSLLLITPVVAFYMLRDWDIFVQKIESLLPRKSKKEIKDLFRQNDLALSGFIRGQLSVCVILGTYYALGLKIVGLDLGALIGFIAGLISFIPYVGSITGFVLAIMLAFSQFEGWTHALAVVVVFIIGQFLEGNFLTPKLVGDKVGLHPVWVMFSLLAGGVLLGFLGLMIAVPLAAVITILLRAFIKKYKKYNI